jgi:predicted transcriptional regulator
MVAQGDVRDVLKKAQDYLSISDIAAILNTNSTQVSRTILALYKKKDIERITRKNGVWVYKISEEKQISDGCRICMFNINEKCTVMGTPDELDWCKRFVNGKIDEILSGKTRKK